MLTAEYLRHRIHYDPVTGVFTWLSNQRRELVGSAAGRLHKVRGYREIYISGKLYYAHRLAWLYMTGAWPSCMVDHIDHNKGNNAWGNLRNADASTNGQNRKGAQKNNKLGVLGVKKNGSGFQANIRAECKNICIGTFGTIGAASLAYKQAKSELHAY